MHCSACSGIGMREAFPPPRKSRRSEHIDNGHVGERGEIERQGERGSSKVHPMKRTSAENTKMYHAQKHVRMVTSGKRRKPERPILLLLFP